MENKINAADKKYNIADIIFDALKLNLKQGFLIITYKFLR